MSYDPLNSSPENHLSDIPVPLNDDQQAFSRNNIKSIKEALSYLEREVATNKLVKSTRYNTLSIVTYRINSLRETLCGNEDLVQDQDHTLQQLRSANEEIRRLNQKMAEFVSIEHVENKLQEINRHIQNWWTELGFSLVDISFSQYHIKLILNVFLRDDVSFFEEKPISVKEQKQQKFHEMSQNLDMRQTESGDYFVLDNDKNRYWLIQQIKDKFPSARILNVENFCVPGKDFFRIRTITAQFPVKDYNG